MMIDHHCEFLNKESAKYFEDGDGFIYKKVNENEKTVYYDCFNEPRCLIAARFYKQTKVLRICLSFVS